MVTGCWQQLIDQMVRISFFRVVFGNLEKIGNVLFEFDSRGRVYLSSGCLFAIKYIYLSIGKSNNFC